MGKTTKTKTLPGDFKVTTLKNLLINNLLINNLAITSKSNLTNYPWPIPNYQPIVESSLQCPIRLDLVVALFPFNAQIPVHD